MEGIVHKSISRGALGGKLFIRSRMTDMIPSLPGTKPYSRYISPEILKIFHPVRKVNPQLQFLSRFVIFHDTALWRHSVFDLSKISASLIADPRGLAERMRAMDEESYRVVDVPLADGRKIPVLMGVNWPSDYAADTMTIYSAGKWWEVIVKWPYAKFTVKVPWKDHLHMIPAIQLLKSLWGIDYYIRITNPENGKRTIILDNYAARQRHGIVGTDDILELNIMEAKYGADLQVEMWGPENDKVAEKIKQFFM